MAAVQCAGLDLTDGLDDGDVPVAALAVLKVLTAEGIAGYTVLATEGLTTTEALGMAELSSLQLRRALAEE